MSFLGKKIKYKFKVDFQLQELTAVPYANSIVFAKVRLMDGGSFHDFSVERPVRSNVVTWNQDFNFQCKMTASAATCMLDECRCRVSIRTVMKGNRDKIKLGFCDVNLAEYASGIQEPQSYLLQPYNPSQRLSNIILHVRVLLSLQSENPVFKAPPRTPLSSSPNASVGDSHGESGDAPGLSSSKNAASASLQRLLSQHQPQLPQRTSSSSGGGDGDGGGDGEGRASFQLLDPRVSAFPGGEVVMVFDAPHAMAPQQQQQRPDDDVDVDDAGSKEKTRSGVAKHSSSNQSLSTIASASLASPQRHLSHCSASSMAATPSRSPTLSKFLDFVSSSNATSASSPSSPVVGRQNLDDDFRNSLRQQQQQQQQQQLLHRLGSQIASRSSLRNSYHESSGATATAAPTSITAPTTSQICSDSDRTSNFDDRVDDSRGESVNHSRNPSNISAGSGYYSLVNTASHSRQSSYNNTAEILHAAASPSAGAASTTPSIVLQQHHKAHHRRQRSEGGVSTTSDPSADEGVGDRSSTTSFNSLKRIEGGKGGGGGGGGGFAVGVVEESLVGSTTPVPSKRDRARFKKLTPDPPSVPSGVATSGGVVVDLRGQQVKCGSHSLLGSLAPVADSSSTSVSDSSHPHQQLYLGLASLPTSMTSSTSSGLTLTTSPHSSTLHGSQRLAETRVSSDAVIDDLFFDATGEGCG